jgi:ABC-2 type transport system permease protein
MRGWKAPALLTLYAGLLAVGVLAILLVASMEPGGVFAPELGSIIYMCLAYGQFALLVFSAPGITAAAISGERERQTLDLLLLTRMTPLQVVAGKLGAALSFTLLLMVASLPVYSVLFLLGGVSLYRLLLTVVVYVVTVVLLGAIGVYFSALFKRTQAAVVAAYGTAVGLMAVPMILSVLHFEVFNRAPDVPGAWGVIYAYLNPLMGLSAAAGGPAADMTRLYQKVLTTAAMREAIWWKFCLTALVLAAGLIWLSARRIRPLKEQ